MSIKNYLEIIKAIIFIVVLVAIGFAVLKGYTLVNNQLAFQEERHKIELEEARKYRIYDADQAANLARANTEIGSLKSEISKLKDEAKSKDNALKEALADIKARKEKITNLGLTIASLENDIRKLRTESSHEYKAGTNDPNEQYFIDIMYPVKDKEGKVEKEIPYAWAIFYPNKPDAEKWKYGIYKLDYNIRTIQTEQKDGHTNTYTEVWFENNQRKASRDYRVPVKIESSEFKQEDIKEQSFYWWTPHLSLNLDAALKTDASSAVGGGISFSTSGYGRTENDLSWKLIDIGLSTNGSETWAKFTPFSYNIGEHIPLISNTFIGPFVGYEFNDGSTIYGLGLSIPF